MNFSLHLNYIVSQPMPYDTVKFADHVSLDELSSYIPVTISLPVQIQRRCLLKELHGHQHRDEH